MKLNYYDYSFSFYFNVNYCYLSPIKLPALCLHVKFINFNMLLNIEKFTCCVRLFIL